jgi:hypothetical protein
MTRLTGPEAAVRGATLTGVHQPGLAMAATAGSRQRSVSHRGSIAGAARRLAAGHAEADVGNPQSAKAHRLGVGGRLHETGMLAAAGDAAVKARWRFGDRRAVLFNDCQGAARSPCGRSSVIRSSATLSTAKATFSYQEKRR